jgi:hypothetical protein
MLSRKDIFFVSHFYLKFKDILDTKHVILCEP